MLSETYPTLAIRLRRLAASRLKSYEKKLRRPFLGPAPSAFRPALGVAKAVAGFHGRLRKPSDTFAMPGEGSDTETEDSGTPRYMALFRSNSMNESKASTPRARGFFPPPPPGIIQSATTPAAATATATSRNATPRAARHAMASPPPAPAAHGLDDTLPSSEDDDDNTSSGDSSSHPNRNQQLQEIKAMAASLLQKIAVLER